jgi:hypothetical protein
MSSNTILNPVNLPNSATGAVPPSYYLPEPSTTGVGVFADVVGAVRSIAGEVGGVSLNPTGSFADLIQAQLQAQMEMQTTSMVSNIERSKHETKMTPVRNIRLG